MPFTSSSAIPDSPPASSTGVTKNSLACTMSPSECSTLTNACSYSVSTISSSPNESSEGALSAPWERPWKSCSNEWKAGSTRICGMSATRLPPPIRRRRESSIESIVSEQHRCGQYSERQPGAQLNFPPRRHRHGDRTELRSIHVPVRCAQVDLVQRIEGLTAKLEAGLFGETEGARQGEVESLQRRTVNRVPPDITERVRGRRHEC